MAGSRVIGRGVDENRVAEGILMPAGKQFLPGTESQRHISSLLFHSFVLLGSGGEEETVTETRLGAGENPENQRAGMC